MAQITEAELATLLDWWHPDICVETGAFEGHFTRLALDWFFDVHSVELSPVLVRGLERIDRGQSQRLIVHEGDSRVIARSLAQTLHEDVFWFFDANWWQRPPGLDPGIAGRRDEYPLWDELRAVAPRGYKDVIVVNEISTFGALSAAGRDRRDVSVDAIRALYPDCRAVLYHDILAIYR